MSKRTKASTTRDQVKGCGCLLMVAMVIIGGCNSLFAGGDITSPIPAVPTAAPVTTWQPKPIDDLDDDGIEDALDMDADGDGVTVAIDRDDQDPSKGKRKPKPKPKPKPEPEPEDEPVAVANAHPGGFCGTSGAIGVASNGRTYICQGGHWRR